MRGTLPFSIFDQENKITENSAPGTVVYKIVDLIEGNIKTLFHGINGSKVMPRGKWITSERKRVRDGTSTTWYESGWHVFENLEDAKHYVKKFANLNPKVIVRGRARDLWPKAHSPSPVMLATDLLIERIVWRANSEALQSAAPA